MDSLVRLMDGLHRGYGELVARVCEIADGYYFLGKDWEALEVLEGARRLVEGKEEVGAGDRLKLDLQYCKILIADYFVSQGDVGLVERVVEESRELAERLGEQAGVALAWLQVGELFYYKRILSGEGDFGAAREWLEKAVSTAESVGEMRVVSEGLFFVGLTYEQNEEPEQAYGYYKRVYDLTGEWGYTLERSYAARHLSSVYLSRKEVEQALPYALESLRLREELGFKRFFPFSNVLVGDIYVEKKEYGEAAKYYQKSLEVAEELGQSSGVVFTLLSLGDMYVADGKEELAREYYGRALERAREVEFGMGISIAEESLARVGK